MLWPNQWWLWPWPTLHLKCRSHRPGFLSTSVDGQQVSTNNGFRMPNWHTPEPLLGSHSMAITAWFFLLKSPFNHHSHINVLNTVKSINHVDIQLQYTLCIQCTLAYILPQIVWSNTHVEADFCCRNLANQWYPLNYLSNLTHTTRAACSSLMSYWNFPISIHGTFYGDGICP
jgi:hypothetical protein